MVDSADLGFYGAAWRFTDFCQYLYARSVYLQLVLKSCELPGLFRSSPRSATRLADVYPIATIVVAGALCSRAFPRRLRAWRERNDLSQSEAALKLQISKRTLQEWEQDRAAPRGFARTAIEKAIRA
jgi:DNA-binding XRE family transcriptional regulator